MSTNVNTKSRNTMIDGLRCIWAICIFLCHWAAQYPVVVKSFGVHLEKWGGYAATGFFILSGFMLSARGSYSRIEDGSGIKRVMIFVCRRCKKLYFLYVICMIPFLIQDIPDFIFYFSNGNKAWENYVMMPGSKAPGYVP